MLPLLVPGGVGVLTAGAVQVVRLDQRSSPSLVSQLQIRTKTADACPPPAQTQLPLDSSTTPLPPTTHDLSTEKQANQRRPLLSGVALGTTCAGHFFLPPLGVLTTPLIVYLEWPMFQTAWRDLVEKRGGKLEGLMALFSTGAWLIRSAHPALLALVWHEPNRTMAHVLSGGGRGLCHLHIRTSQVRDSVRFEEVPLGYPPQWQAMRGIAGYLRKLW